MPVPSPRNKILPARGNYVDLLANVALLGDGEICYAIDQDTIYVKEGTTLVSVNAVDSVAGKTGDVTLVKADITDFSDADYATAAQGATADSAVQPGDLATVATSGSYNDLSDQPTIPPAAPVDSVAGKTGAVTLVKADITDFADGDYATAAQGATADSAAQPTGTTYTGTLGTTERTITAGAFDLATGNHWTCGAITVPAPTNATAGTSGLIRITAGPVVWNTVFKFPGGTAPTIASFPAIIPFYVQDASNILMGNVAEGIA